MSDTLTWIMFLLAVAAATGLVFSRDWRASLVLLAALYLSVFWMVQARWPVSMAATRLITGWMACAVLVIARRSSPPTAGADGGWQQGRLFHVFATGMVLVAALAVSFQAAGWLGVSLPLAGGSLALIGLGLLHLGVTSDPFEVITGLLTTLAGFEILYASVESSALVAALLAAVTLGLALAGAWFLNAAGERTP